jgi:hypothetical protein
MRPHVPYFSNYSVECQTILLVKGRVLDVNGLTRLSAIDYVDPVNPLMCNAPPYVPYFISIYSV